MRHINRKFPCKNKDIIDSDIKKNDDKNIYDIVNELVIEKNKMKVSIEEIKLDNKKILSENNKIIKDNKKLMKKNKDLINKVNILEGILTNNKNGNIYMDVENFVVNNGINIVEFGKERWNFLTNEQKLKILDGGFKSVQRYVQLVHMNKEKPEYSNIYVKNWKDSKGGVMINDGNEWIRCKNEVIDDLRDRGIDFVDITHEYLKSKDLLPEHIDKKIERFTKELYGDNGEELRKKISSDIKLDLYNYGKKAIK
jgi:hypothetical protein